MIEARIKSDGVMEIVPTTELEAYALEKWLEDNLHIDGDGQTRMTSLMFMPMEGSDEG